MKKHGMSRRNFLKGSALAASAGGLTAAVASATAGGSSERGEDLVLVNGRIHTMDDQNRIVDSVAIRNGRFVSIGHDSGSHGGKRIDLRGRTVVPGIIESHTHFVSLANRPGYHVAQWELANSISEVLAILAERRARGDVPPGAFITAMGAGTPRMFAENRLPTLQEIDAAVSDRPVFLYQGGGGPARTNSLGKAFFATVTNPTVTVGADGTIAGGNPSQANAALYHLRIRQTFDDKKRSALDAQAYSASVGITAVLDQTLVARADGTLNPALYDPQPTDALFTLNHYRMYDAWLQLEREHRNLIRLQINFLHNQGFDARFGATIESQLPELRERLKNQFPFFGNDMVRTMSLPKNGNWFLSRSRSSGSWLSIVAPNRASKPWLCRKLICSRMRLRCSRSSCSHASYMR